MPAPLHIIAGFLGSGKTTLMNRLLSALPDDCKAALIVNDFGEVALDGELIDRGHYAMRELASGCVCCTLKGPLLETLHTLATDESPDLILMETTGVAEPAEIALSIRSERLAQVVTLGNIVCVVDAASFLRYEKGIVILGKQAAQANTIVLNKMDLVAGEVLEAVRNRIDFLRVPDSVVIESDHCEVEAETLLTVRMVPMPVTHGHRHHDEEFQSFSVDSDAVVDLVGLEVYLKDLGEEVHRAKGIVRTDKGARLVQWTPSSYEITEWAGEAATSRFVCIGKGLQTEELEARFRALCS